MQWQSVYEPSMNEGLGIIVMDSELRSKIIQRFAPSGFQCLFPVEELKAGESLLSGGACYGTPGNWRKAARSYAQWFNHAFKLRQPPQCLMSVTCTAAGGYPA